MAVSSTAEKSTSNVVTDIVKPFSAGFGVRPVADAELDSQHLVLAELLRRDLLPGLHVERWGVGRASARAAAARGDRFSWSVTVLPATGDLGGGPIWDHTGLPGAGRPTAQEHPPKHRPRRCPTGHCSSRHSSA